MSVFDEDFSFLLYLLSEWQRIEILYTTMNIFSFNVTGKIATNASAFFIFLFISSTT